MKMWIQTHSGRKFEPEEPRAEDIFLDDIAHSLSMQCRFNGNCIYFYSVAEHSVRVSHLLPDELALQGLLHDAAEAYIGDLVAPIKRKIPEFSQIEGKAMAAVAERFGLPPVLDPVVHKADLTMLATEARDLMREPPEDWGLAHEPLKETLYPWNLSCRAIARVFKSRFKELGGREWLTGKVVPLDECCKPVEKAPSGDLREALADYAHKAWSGWMKYLFEKSKHNSDGTVTIPAWAVERWSRQLATSYSDLPGEEKDSDRAEADKMLAVFSSVKIDRE